ncbi:hypothetical protein D3C85_1284570 [compost metagenome]
MLSAFLQLGRHTGEASSVIVRQNGTETVRLPLRLNRLHVARGPLGLTEIEIHNGQARIRRDPGPRQYCVQQGWLRHSGDIAVCLPNRVSIELAGADQAHDSLAY